MNTSTLHSPQELLDTASVKEDIDEIFSSSEIDFKKSNDDRDTAATDADAPKSTAGALAFNFETTLSDWFPTPSA